MSQSDSQHAIETQELCVYFGDVCAVDRLSITVEPGDIFGFIGPNGAGKTTTIKTLVTLLRPTSGTAQVYGHSVALEDDEVRKIVGYMPDYAAAYPHMCVDDYLDFFAAAYGIDRAERPKVVDDVLELTDLKTERATPVGALSRGMQQRVSLARVLVHSPQVLILDEPASGLDPRARIEMMEILRELAKMGKTIFISSHILSELRLLCNRVAIIDLGRLVYCGGLAELLRRVQGQRRIIVQVNGDGERAASLLSDRPEVADASLADRVITLTLAPGAADISFIAETLVRHAVKVQTIREEEVLLEDAFMKITHDA